ncbi:MAG: hypothetical protein JSU66_02485 [Deltaproteobacteria bacterium]|nr:MAG: hypothetical protein JSU66_02485 [Deltaproteobacteria bacterium]
MRGIRLPVHRRTPPTVTRTELPPSDRAPDVCALRLEYTSCGDWVPTRLLHPAGRGPFPLVLLQHALGGSKQDADLDRIAAHLARAGAAVASLDFPLHGERSNPKLSARFAAAVSRAQRGEAVPDAGWLGSIAAQAVEDLSRALDALGEQPEVDAERIGYAGLGLGASLGARFCSEDARPRAVVLCLCGGGVGPAELDAARYIGGIAPRPVLLVNPRRDAALPAGAADALFAAAREPKREIRCGDRGAALAADAWDGISGFLEDALRSGGG